MLTGYQVETIAYMTEYGELLCPDCFDIGDELARPVSRYSLDEWQAEQAYDFEWYEDDGIDHAEVGCMPAINDENGHELVEEWHEEHPEGEGDEDE